MPAPVAVPVGLSFPGADCRQVRRLQRCDKPLVLGVIRDPVDPDFAVAPGLRCRPLDAVMEVFDLPLEQQADLAGAAPGAAPIDPDAGVAVRNPFLRIDEFPGLERAGRAFRDVGVGSRHPVPAALVGVLERHSFAIRARRR